ncbi:MAG: hypothetical protein APR63_08695 [Desulfuromonas sp. SDB]|nr:MAG: hypothetical protein APR63_08695 [Desulfuromonas sp. SDB]
MVLFLLFFISNLTNENCNINYSFYYILEAEKEYQELSDNSKQESFEDFYGVFNINFEDVLISLKPIYEEPNINLTLNEIYYKKNGFLFGLINPEFGGYFPSIASAKYHIFPYCGRYNPGNIFGFNYKWKIFSLTFGGRSQRKFFGLIRFKPSLGTIKYSPFYIFSGRDDQTSSYHTHIMGLELEYWAIKTGMDCKICHYEKKIISNDLWIRIQLPVNSLNFEGDCYYSNTSPYFEGEMRENDFLYSSSKINYKVNDELYVFIGGNYYFRETVKNLTRYSLVLGFVYNVNRNNVSISSGYENSENLLLRCQGYIEKEYCF